MENIVNYEFLRKEYGYERYKCKICGEYFYSRVPRDVCPDRPCSKYEFLYKKYSRMNPLSLNEVRKKFIDFLVKRNHGVVDPYPVLAKWRNDLYLTIASIVVFQPLVTDGVVEPPHNPLVIIQPSIRLTDIDNVGLTFGRHLSSFEMGGMHAFNKNNKMIYWSDGILKNTIDFFTEEIGIDLDDLVFKEGWWEGGGNAGPAPEVLVDGMEVATLVHMAYKVVNGKYELNPVLVVDCGYGMERIAWLTQKTPTGFHAIYGSLLGKYRDILGVEEPPYDVLKNIVYLLSDKEITGISELVREIESIGYKHYTEQVVDSIYLYSILDHVKTLSLMLADGIVPSNTGEGYLARLVLRKLLRNLLLLGVEQHRLPDVLAALADEQIKYWVNDYIYGKLEKHRDYIIDVLQLEASKYTSTILKGIEVIEKIIKKRKTIELDDLIELYDSHGIPPEIIAEKAKTHGATINVPENFYSIVAGKHASPRVIQKSEEEEGKLSEEISKWAMEYPETRRVFHENPYITSIEAVVQGVNRNHVILDATVAYPWAGGQDHDKGVIKYNGEEYEIRYVGKVGNVIVHVVDREPAFKPGDRVVVEIDWDRRYTLMKHHTATHVILAAARMVLGDHVWQAGAEKTIEKGRLDITHHKLLTEEEIEKIENTANKIISSRIDVKFNYLDRFQAEKKHGLKIYQGGAVYSPIIRIVEIPGYDAQACFGTHLYNTSEIGAVKIINAERIQDGVVRLEYIAGNTLVNYIKELEREKTLALAAINVRDRDLVSAVKKLYSEYSEQKTILETYRKMLEEAIISKTLSEKTDICGIPIVYVELPIRDDKLIKSIIEELSFKHKTLAVIAVEDMIELSLDPSKAHEYNIDLRNTIQYLSEHGVKGGGKPDHIVLKSTRRIEKELVIEAIRKTTCKP